MATQNKDITFIIPGQAQPGGAAGGATRARAGGGSVKASVRVGTQRGDGDALRVTAQPGEDVVVLHITNGPTLVLHPEDARVLPGVTRSMVLEIARGLMPLGAGPARADALGAIEEAFITSVSREILPVIGIDGATFGDGKPGPVTKELIRRFAEAIANERETVA